MLVSLPVLCFSKAWEIGMPALPTILDEAAHHAVMPRYFLVQALVLVWIQKAGSEMLERYEVPTRHRCAKTP